MKAHTLVRAVRRVIPWTLLVGAALGAGHLRAQTWQAHYGGAFPEEARGGVAPVRVMPGGGYVTTGYTYSSSAGLAADIHVMRVNTVGTIVWNFVYDIGGNDIPNEIHETSDGGYIVVGGTNNTPTSCSPGEIFLMRLNNAGGLVWVRTYGGLDGESGASVIQTQNGEFVVAGATGSFGVNPTINTPPYSGFESDGYLIRTDGSGNVIWGRTFGAMFRDIFRSVTEVTTGPNSGDIVAAGETYSFTPQPSPFPYGFIVRVTSTGLLDPATYPSTWARTYGGGTTLGVPNRVWFNCVRACTDATNRAGRPGTECDLVVTGSCGGTQDHLYVMSLNASGTIYAAATYSTPGAGDQGQWIEEIRAGAPFVNGHFAIAGRQFNPGGLGAQDVYALEVPSPRTTGGVFAPPIWSRDFGGFAQDDGWAIFPVAAGTPNGNPGFIIAGSTSSFTNPDFQHYLIKTNLVGLSGCNEVVANAMPTVTNDVTLLVTPQSFKARVEGASAAYPQSVWPGTLLCINPTGKTVGNDALTDDGGTSPGGSEVVDMQNGGFDLYPNPVSRGSKFQVEYTLSTPEPAAITITDLLGRPVFTADRAETTGTIRVPVSTEGWAAGSYVINVRLGRSMQTRRIVVGDTR